MLNIFKVLNLKPNQNFKINSLAGIYYISEQGVMYKTSPDGYRVNSDEVEGFIYRRALNDGITPIQKITEKQTKLLESLFFLGYRYIAKDKDSTFWVFESEPVFIGGEWDSDSNCIIDSDMPKTTRDAIKDLVGPCACFAIKELFGLGGISDGTN